jgi:hypothetical protein
VAVGGARAQVLAAVTELYMLVVISGTVSPYWTWTCPVTVKAASPMTVTW